MKFFFKKIRKRLLFAEITLLIASVFIFRGLWLLLDMMPIMFTPELLWASFGGGVIISIVSLRYIIKNNKD